MNKTVLNAFHAALNDSQVNSPNAHEEGGTFKQNQVDRAERGKQGNIKVPFIMKNGDLPDGRFHTHPNSNETHVPGTPPYVVYKDPAIPSKGDKERAGAIPDKVRNYIITPEGKIVRYNSEGAVEEDLGTINSRLNKCE